MFDLLSDSNPFLIIATSVAVLVFLALYAGITSVVERKIAGRIQSRVGPNHVFFRGFAQFIADILKAIQKEDITPAAADPFLFKISPYMIFVGIFLAWVVVPFGSVLIAADLNTGILYVFAVSSFTLVGVLLAGWSSNNKWSLIGAMRGAAQIVSYEIPSGLAVLTVILLSGSLSLQTIIRGQGVWPTEWYIAHDPFTLVSFFILFISLLAEGNRTPFDLSESESELVGGFTTEYSGFRFLLILFSEYANLYIISVLLVSLYLGGWNSPFSLGFDWNGRFIEMSGFFIFLFKNSIITFLVILVRWTLPRIRIDQLTTLCWKYLTPISFVNLFGVAIWMVLFPERLVIVSWILTGLLASVTLLFLYRVVVVNLIRMKADIDLNPLF